MSETALMEQ